MTKLILIATAVAVVACAQGAESATTGAPVAKPCFAIRDWQGWSASADGDAIYLRVSMRDVYRIDLTPGSHVRKEFDRFLVNRVRGSDWVCSPLDLDLTISDRDGFREPLFPRSLRKLSPAEIAAIPRKDLP